MVKESTRVLISDQLTKPLLVKEILSFSNRKGTIDLAALQSQEPRTIWVTMDREGNLSIDAPTNYWLVAEVAIPPAQYVSIGKDEETQKQKRIPMAPDKVHITVWPLPHKEGI